MNPDSFRRALRAGLPWQSVGFGLMALGVAVPAVLAFDALRPFVESWHLGAIARGIGVLGAVLFLGGTFLSARSRHASRLSAGLVAAAVFWTGEFCLRLAGLGGEPQSGKMLAARVGLAGLGSLAFAAGMLFVLPGTAHRSVRQGWRTARIAFAAQLAIFVLVPILGWVLGSKIGDWLVSADALPSFWKALLWIAFAAPYVLFWLCLRRTAGALSGRETISDILLR